MRIARLLTKRCSRLEANEGQDCKNHADGQTASCRNRAQGKWLQSKATLLTNVEQDNHRQDDAHTYFKDHKGQVNVRGLLDTPVTEGKSDTKGQDIPEAPVQIQPKPAHYKGFQVGTEQRKRIGDAESDRYEPTPRRQVA